MGRWKNLLLSGIVAFSSLASDAYSIPDNLDTYVQQEEYRPKSDPPIEQSIRAYHRSGIRGLQKDMGLSRQEAIERMNDIRRQGYTLQRASRSLLSQKEMARIVDCYMTSTIAETRKYVEENMRMQVSTSTLYRILDEYGKKIGLAIRKSDERLHKLYIREKRAVNIYKSRTVAYKHTALVV